MKQCVIALSVIALIAACAHTPRALGLLDLAGDYLPTSESFGGYRLDQGGAYYVFDFLMKSPLVQDGKVIGEGVDGVGWVKRGTWTYADGILILRSSDPSEAAQRFAVVGSPNSITISSTENRMESYKKSKGPNQLPVPTATSGRGTS